MKLIDWAKEEIRLAKEFNEQDAYSSMCLDSALKAFESLVEDNHSGLSIRITKNILCNLIDGRPLTPVKNGDEWWEDCGCDMWQHKRMPSLFKNVSNGITRYTDNNYVLAKYELGDDRFHTKIAYDCVYSMFPITFPYIPPDKPYVVTMESFVYDGHEYTGLLYVDTPENERIKIGRFFKLILSDHDTLVNIPIKSTIYYDAKDKNRINSEKEKTNEI